MSGNKERSVDICPKCGLAPDMFMFYLITDGLTSTLIGWLHRDIISYKRSPYKAEISASYRRSLYYGDYRTIPDDRVEVRCGGCGFLPLILGGQVWKRFKEWAEQGFILIPPERGFF